MSAWAESWMAGAAWASLGVSGLALAMTMVNLRVYRRASALGSQAAAPVGASSGRALVSLCIPARNEEANIEAAVRGALASQGVDIEVLVYDDESTDRTPRLVAELCAADSRVRSVPTQTLPAGWNGKQWACQRMGSAARGDWLLFTDADVRMRPDGAARAVQEAVALKAALISTVPWQVTGSLAERVVVPLIHWMLLSWLPMPRMRSTNDPATSAGCGQFLLVRREAWAAVGGHSQFADSMHDGIKLPRALRRQGFHTDLFDGTDLVSCRMYQGAGQVWRGFTKNAYEGLGSPVVLGVFTVLEALTLAAWPLALAGSGVATAAVALQLAQRAAMAARFRQSWLGAALHPVGMACLLAIQWRSWWLHRTGRRSWRGRTSGVGAAAGPATCPQSAPAPSGGTGRFAP